MKHAAPLLISLSLLACAPVPSTAVAPAPAPQNVALQSASIEVRSWGKLLHSWTLAADGTVEHVTDPGTLGAPRRPFEVRRIALDAAQQAALTGALGKVAAIAATPAQCASEVTDMPYGNLAWKAAGVPHSLDWQSGCIEGRDANLWRAIKEADSIVDSAARATPVVETRPNDGSGKGS